MFEARFTSATLLKRILDAVKDLVTEANLLVTEDGIELQAMDSAHVALINFTILAEACSLYTCDQQTVLGVNLTNFSKIMKCAEPTDSVILTHEPDAAQLLITFESNGGSKRQEFGMNLMDIESDHLEIPDTEYACSIKLPSSEFSKLIHNLSNFGDQATLSVQPEVFTMSVTGDTGTATMTVNHDLSAKQPLLRTEIACGKSTKLDFALKYLAAFTKASPLSDQVQIAMSADVPVYVCYDMDHKGSVGFYLAPKMME
jgi:proliferating cell nuclear antigen